MSNKLGELLEILTIANSRFNQIEYEHMKILDGKTKQIFLCVLVLFTASCAGVPLPDSTNTLILDHGAEWHYFAGTDNPPPGWNSRGFNDSLWVKGASGFGYGPGNHNTVLSDMKGKYKNMYVRHDFTVIDYSKITKMVLSIVCDGPFTAYLNGIEAIRSRKPQRGDPLNMTGFSHEMYPGKNVIAIQCSNDDINSDDYSFIPAFEFHESNIKVQGHSH